MPQVERDTARQSAIARRRSSGLRVRLLIVDVAAAAGTWLVLGTINMPATTASRQWGAALAATAVTLVAMQLLGLYRSRLCVQRGQETARIVVAVVAGAVTLELLRGDGDRSYAAAIVAAGSCILALMTLRWMFRQWLRAQRAQGRYRRGLVMIGTNEDAVAVWTMLHSQPELGYEVRGIIGKPRRRSDWAHLPNGRALDQLPDIARQTDATGVLLVANALSAAEVHDVIELSIGKRPARAGLAGLPGVGNAPGPPLSNEWRNVPLRRTRTTSDVAIRGETSRRPARSSSRFADRRTGPSRWLGSPSDSKTVAQPSTDRSESG